ncbi:hypothetical protein GCM10010251_11670 [Streptomyces aurantiogriseus]|uniref:Uncharacterized protein n=1 Tax=Streptomyces aurantiogriseus TaxID=66870 RepID=A0A918BZV6_9ACTN|nr:hypothetical protein GCM10010251_11670 [Streptomyces aurantiogriseus]
MPSGQAKEREEQVIEMDKRASRLRVRSGATRIETPEGGDHRGSGGAGTRKTPEGEPGGEALLRKDGSNAEVARGTHT